MLSDYLKTFLLDGTRVTAHMDRSHAVHITIDKKLSPTQRRRVLAALARWLITQVTDKQTTTFSISSPSRRGNYQSLREMICLSLEARPKQKRRSALPAKRKREDEQYQADLSAKKAARFQRELHQKLDQPVTKLSYINSAEWKKLGMLQPPKLIGQLVRLSEEELRERGASTKTIERIKKALNKLDLELNMNRQNWKIPKKQ